MDRLATVTAFPSENAIPDPSSGTTLVSIVKSSYFGKLDDLSALASVDIPPLGGVLLKRQMSS